MESVPLIDLLSEDDLLISSSSQEFELDTAVSREEKTTQFKQMDQFPDFTESPKQKSRSDRFNMRKSLAWDSEFFTCEGFLNSGELAIVNNTYSNAEGITLPRIQEELKKSTESTSTSGRGSSALEQLGKDLFDNLRLSTPQSLVHSSETKDQKRTLVPSLRSVKKLDVLSQTMIKPSTALKRGITTRQEQDALSSNYLVHGMRAASRCRESKTWIKPPKLPSKTITSPTVPSKNGSVKKQLKCNTGKASVETTGKRQSVSNEAKRTSKLIPLKDTGSSTPRANLRLLMAASPSLSSSASSPSDAKSESPLVTIRSVKRNASFSSLGLTSNNLTKRASSRTGSKWKSCHFDSSKSMSFVSSVSPSSSSTSMKRSKLTECSDAGLSSSPSRTVSPAIEASKNSGSKLTLSYGSGRRSAMSSRLRMPSSTIGYFDKDKTPIRSSCNYLHNGFRNSFVMAGEIIENLSANKVTPSKQPSARAPPHSPANQNSKSTKPHKESSPKTAVNNCKLSSNSPSKKNQPNLLRPKLIVENETSSTGEQNISDSSSERKQVNDERPEIGLNVAKMHTEKENLCPALNTEGSFSDLQIEDQHKAAVELLREKDELEVGVASEDKHRESRLK